MAIEIQVGEYGKADRTDARPNSRNYKTILKAETYESVLAQLAEQINKGRVIFDGRTYIRIKKGNIIINI